MSFPGSLGPSVWAASDGRAGNAALVRAIVAALGERSRWMQVAHIAGEAHRDEPLRFSPRAPWVWLPGDRWPMPLLSLPVAERAQLAPPWPTVWIAAGRRTAALSRYVRERSDGRTYTVHLLDPYIAADNFDLLVVPEHDSVRGANVMTVTGSPAHFSEDAIDEAGQAFADLSDEPGRAVLIALGGESRVHSFTQAAADRLEEQFRALAAEGWRLRITASRRTPVPVAARMRNMAAELGARFWNGVHDGPNPYLAWLAFSQAAIVTEDSANMLSEAAWHGLPLHIARLEGRSDKFDKLYESLIACGAARWFGGTLDQWTYRPLREAERVADRIVAGLLSRYPAPGFAGSPQPPARTP